MCPHMAFLPGESCSDSVTLTCCALVLLSRPAPRSRILPFPEEALTETLTFTGSQTLRRNQKGGEGGEAGELTFGKLQA